MTQDEIIEITRQAGGFSPTPEFLETFAKLIAKKAYLEGVNSGISAEREACAQIGDSFHDDEANCGDLIRARGEA